MLISTYYILLSMVRNILVYVNVKEVVSLWGACSISGHAM